MKLSLARMLSGGRGLVRRLRADRRGNVMMILGFAMVPLTFSVGFGIDYSRAMKLETKMNAAADAAALAAVNIKMMQQSDDQAKAAARAMFNAQVKGLAGMIYDTNDVNNPTITVTSSGGVNSGRTVKVAYVAGSQNIFSGVLGSPVLTIAGSAEANATRAPHINFFLLMDTSPSMLLPATSTGLTNIRAKTGCAFACHQQTPRNEGVYVRNSSSQDIWVDWGTGNWCAVKTVGTTQITCQDNTTKYTKSNGQYADSYWLARNYATLWGGDNIPLRIDEEQAAAQGLIPFAITTASNNQVTYKLQLFTFDYTRPGNTHPVKTITSTMADVNTMSTYTVPNFYAMQDNWASNGCPTATWCNNDMGSEVTNALTRMNSVMPAPGDGTTAANPQEVLFIISDGITDELKGASRWNREWSSQVLGQCTSIKNRGIRIAILYTEYLPESMTGDSWSQSNVKPYLPNVEPALKSCASARTDGTPLYYKVTTDESISAALTALFSLTVQSAHLTK